MRVHLQYMRQWEEDRGVPYNQARELEAYVGNDGVALYTKGTFTEYDKRQEIRLTKESALLLAKTILTMIVGK